MLQQFTVGSSTCPTSAAEHILSDLKGNVRANKKQVYRQLKERVYKEVYTRVTGTLQVITHNIQVTISPPLNCFKLRFRASQPDGA